MWPIGISNIICKRFVVKTLPWSLEFVIQINLEYNSIAVWNMAQNWSISNSCKLSFFSGFLVIWFILTTSKNGQTICTTEYVTANVIRAFLNICIAKSCFSGGIFQFMLTSAVTCQSPYFWLVPTNYNLYQNLCRENVDCDFVWNFVIFSKIF